MQYTVSVGGAIAPELLYTEWRTKYYTIDCARKTFLLLQKHLTSGTKLIHIGWKIVPNEEHVQCDHDFASQPRTLAFVTTFRHKSSESARHNFTMWALSCLFLMKNMFNVTTILPHNHEPLHSSQLFATSFQKARGTTSLCGP